MATISNASIQFDHAERNADGSYDLYYRGSVMGVGAAPATVTINDARIVDSIDQLEDASCKLINLSKSVSPGTPFEIVIRTPKIPDDVEQVQVHFSANIQSDGGMSSYSMSMSHTESVNLEEAEAADDSDATDTAEATSP